MTIYTTGTASVTAEETTVTFAGVSLGTAVHPVFKPGDLFADPAQPLVPPQRIASIDYDAGTAELWADWPGATMSADPYEVRFVEEGARSTAQTRRYLELLGQLSALGLQPKAFGDFTDRDAYDDQKEGFIFLSLDGDGVTDVWTLYIKLSDADADWDAGQQVAGAAGDPGSPGSNGWSPVYALEADGDRRVKKLVAYVGGTGDAPADHIGEYVGTGGYEVEIANGVDVRGAAGAPGAAGAFLGVHQTYSSTTADADPGAGFFRFDNTTIASVTKLWADDLDKNGNSITNWLQSMDDSTSDVKGVLMFRGITNPTAWAAFKVTGAVVNKTDYKEVPLSYVNAGGPWSSATDFTAFFIPTGDAGDGAVSSVNGQSGAVTLDPDDLDDASTTHKFASSTQLGKVDHLSVTEATDLDEIRTRVTELDAAVVLKGSWDASAGTFPGSGNAQAGASYIVTVAGTVDGVSFAVNDRLLAIADDASTTTFASNWMKLDYTDQVLSVDGATGAVTVGSIIAAATGKTTPVDGDSVALSDSEASGATKKLTWANLKATLKTYFDSVVTKLTNKRIQARRLAITSSATPTINTDLYDLVDITALATTITSMTTNLTGTPDIGDVLIFQIKDNGTARAITWGASFTAKGVALPTTTVVNKLLTVGFCWNGTNWGCVGSSQEA